MRASEAAWLITDALYPTVQGTPDFETMLMAYDGRACNELRRSVLQTKIVMEEAIKEWSATGGHKTVNVERGFALIAAGLIGH